MESLEITPMYDKFSSVGYLINGAIALYSFLLLAFIINSNFEAPMAFALLASFVVCMVPSLCLLINGEDTNKLLIEINY